MWDDSKIEEREWQLDSWDIDDGVCYKYVRVNRAGVSWYLFNDTRNVASIGGHSGQGISLDDFLQGRFDASKTDAGVLQEIKEHILQYRIKK